MYVRIRVSVRIFTRITHNTYAHTYHIIILCITLHV